MDTRQSSDHQMHQCRIYERFTDIRACFVVLTQVTIRSEPGNGACTDPAPRHHRESRLPFRTLDDSEDAPTHGCDPFHQPASPPSAHIRRRRDHRRCSPVLFVHTRKGYTKDPWQTHVQTHSEDTEYKGTVPVVVQDLVLRTDNVRFLQENKVRCLFLRTVFTQYLGIKIESGTRDTVPTKTAFGLLSSSLPKYSQPVTVLSSVDNFCRHFFTIFHLFNKQPRHTLLNNFSQSTDASSYNRTTKTESQVDNAALRYVSIWEYYQITCSEVDGNLLVGDVTII